MTSENEVAVRPAAAERVGMELSRWFNNGDFASRTPAAATLVSAVAALRSGFFSNAMLAACDNERGEGSGGA